MWNFIEQKLALPAALVLTIASLSLIVLTLALLVVGYAKGIKTDTTVRLEELDLSPEAQAELPIVTPDKMEIVKRYFADKKNEEILNSWYGAIPEDQRADFLANLSIVISDAEKTFPDNRDAVIAAVNAYKVKKFEKLASAGESQTMMVARTYFMAFAALLSLGLIGLFVIALAQTVMAHKARFPS